MQVIKRRPNVIRPRTIGFYLDKPLFIHLGDQLFFEPVVRLLMKDLDVYIRLAPEMTEYFVKSGAKVINDEKIFACDILVTRDELLPDVLFKTQADILSINTLSTNMRYRITEEITCRLARFLLHNRRLLPIRLF